MYSLLITFATLLIPAQSLCHIPMKSKLTKTNVLMYRKQQTLINANSLYHGRPHM